MLPAVSGLLLALVLLVAALVLLAVLVCLLLVAALALVVLLERTGTDVPAAVANARQRRQEAPRERPAGPAARTPWSKRTPAPGPARPAPAEPAEDAPADGADPAATARLPVVPAEPPKASAARTRPVRRAAKAAAPPDQADDRDAAMQRLFAPLTDSDRTEPLPRADEDR